MSDVQRGARVHSDARQSGDESPQSMRFARSCASGDAVDKRPLLKTEGCKSRLKAVVVYLILRPVKQHMDSPNPPPEGCCAGLVVCPLSRVRAGSVVCIRQLTTSPEMTDRLREMGFCEQQRIKLLARNSSLICQVCNARLGISEQLAEAILVETVAASVAAA
jgi:Fe2+ transport system protein FeoA